MKGFRKRYLTSPGQFFGLLWRVLAAKIRAIFIGRSNRISRAFAERINLAISGVSECAYCSHLHARLALESGVSEGEIRSMLGGDLDGCPVDEAPVLAYAIHWAESNGRPSMAVRGHAVKSAGQTRILQAEAIMAAVYLGNMCSNAIEARQAGVQPRSVDSFLAFILAWPVAMFVKTLGRYPG